MIEKDLDNKDSLTKQKALAALGARGHLTLEQVFALCDNPKYGSHIKLITINDLVCSVQGTTATPVKTPKAKAKAKKATTKKATTKKATTKKATKKPSAKPKAKKTTKKATKKATKKTTKKAAAKKGSAKSTAKKAAIKKGPVAKKADAGTKKPRLNYQEGMATVFKALKKAGEAVSREALDNQTGYEAHQTRAFIKKLMGEGKVQQIGSGKRGTKYALA
jgi:outer membrane biosynthesis protein TonB